MRCVNLQGTLFCNNYLINNILLLYYINIILVLYR